MSSGLMLRELSDDELEMVIGGSGRATPRITENITIVENSFEFIYAPVVVYGTVTNSTIGSGNSYTQNTTQIANLGHHHR